MALHPAALERLDAVMEGSDAVEPQLAALRKELAGVSITCCDPRDLDGEEPFRSYPQGSLFLVDGTQHCWTITQQPERATGIVLAVRRGA